MQRVIVWFSCGSASAVAGRCALKKYPKEQVSLVYCDVSRSEDEDNVRFRNDVSLWLNHEIKVIGSDRFSDVDEVIESRRYISGIQGAPCTVELKKIPRFNFQEADDIHIFGFTSDETDRVVDFERNNPDMILDWILLEKRIFKEDCHRIITEAGIATPKRYLQGFVNNNCKCCTKATSIAYWILSRKVNPVEFQRRCEQSRRLGVRMTRWKGKRIFLDEIPPDDQIPARFLIKSRMENISCGPECGAK